MTATTLCRAIITVGLAEHVFSARTVAALNDAVREAVAFHQAHSTCEVAYVVAHRAA